MVKAGVRRVHVTCRTRVRPAVSHNVVGRVKGRDVTAPALSLSAHYDTVPGTPGAGDNAGGVAVAMAAAECLQRRPPRGDVHVVLFGGEEIGLAGARAYARAHRERWPGMRLAVYFDGMGDVIGRNKLQVNGYHDLMDWAMGVADACGYRCDAQDSISMLDNAWLNYHGVASIRPWRPPQHHWHGARDDMSVMGEQVLLDNAAYAVELLQRASEPDAAPFTPGVPYNMVRRIREGLDGRKLWGYGAGVRAS
jgi:Iap family predicted aminopeptidase